MLQESSRGTRQEHCIPQGEPVRCYTKTVSNQFCQGTF
uniref:Uncharacterized protein n=1 Tax=Anguilla anguilla TaxID=7936 RepID=A0A0E9TMU6_ANGAN